MVQYRLIPVKDIIGGNYYPVTNRVRIQDSKKFLTIFTDRTHGGTSLYKGHLELMVQRRIRNPLEARSIFERGQFKTGKWVILTYTDPVLRGCLWRQSRGFRGPMDRNYYCW